MVHIELDDFKIYLAQCTAAIYTLMDEFSTIDYCESEDTFVFACESAERFFSEFLRHDLYEIAKEHNLFEGFIMTIPKGVFTLNRIHDLVHITTPHYGTMVEALYGWSNEAEQRQVVTNKEHPFWSMKSETRLRLFVEDWEEGLVAVELHFPEIKTEHPHLDHMLWSPKEPLSILSLLHWILHGKFFDKQDIIDKCVDALFLGEENA